MADQTNQRLIICLALSFYLPSFLISLAFSIPGFFGVQHVAALLQILSPHDLPLVVENCLHNLQDKVNSDLAAYAHVLLEAIPPIKLPSMKYGVCGAYGYFDLKLKDIASYPPLRPQVFQLLREIGNALIFILLFETCSNTNEALQFCHEAFFMGIKPFIAPTTPTGSQEAADQIQPSFDVSTGPSPFVQVMEMVSKSLAAPHPGLDGELVSVDCILLLLALRHSSHSCTFVCMCFFARMAALLALSGCIVPTSSAPQPPLLLSFVMSSSNFRNQLTVLVFVMNGAKLRR